MIKVVSYLKGIPANNNNPKKPKALIDFIQGVNAVGDQGIINNENNFIPAEVAVIQGFVHEQGKQAPHLTFRKNIIDYQSLNNNRTIIIDSNLFLYKDPENLRGYLRYSYDGIFPNTGEYCYDNPNPKRWEKIKQDLNIDLKPWRKQGNHILLCLQRNGGWSMKGITVIDFFNQVVNEIRQYSDRPIIVRTHPGDRRSIEYSRHLTGDNVHLSSNKTFLQDLENAWATVVYNSSPSVASVIEGIPTFVIDSEYSQAKDVCNINLSNIENPILLDRLQWIRKIAQCHWSESDLISGEAWKHMRQWARRQ